MRSQIADCACTHPLPQVVLTVSNKEIEMMNSVIRDLRFALRGLLKHPAFTAIAVVTLALGIGGSTSIFTVVDAALLRGLPYKSPDRLYHLWEQTPQQAYPKREFSYPDYQDYKQNNVFDALAMYT